MYYFPGSAKFAIFEYDLSTPYDISTGTYVTQSADLTFTGYPYGLYISRDGLNLFYTDTTVVRSYSMSTAWDLSTLSSVTSFTVSGQDSSMQSLDFSNDGKTMWTVGSSNDRVYQYSLSTAFDLSTASYTGNFFSVSSQVFDPRALFVSEDYSKFWVGQPNSVFEYDVLDIADISTASYSGDSYTLSETSTASGFYFDLSSLNLYVCDNSTDNIFQYDIATSFAGTAYASFDVRRDA